MRIEQYEHPYDHHTVVRLDRIIVRVPDTVTFRTRKPPAAVALDAFYSWIGQYADFVQQRFERVV